jgi:N-acyl-D-aspartate/D-glutamate deacylase
MADDNRTSSSSGVDFTNVRILDGSGDYPFTGDVTVQGNRIRSVTRSSSRINGAGAGGQTVIDGTGSQSPSATASTAARSG